MLKPNTYNLTDWEIPAIREFVFAHPADDKEWFNKPEWAHFCYRGKAHRFLKAVFSVSEALEKRYELPQIIIGYGFLFESENFVRDLYMDPGSDREWDEITVASITTWLIRGNAGKCGCSAEKIVNRLIEMAAKRLKQWDCQDFATLIKRLVFTLKSRGVVIDSDTNERLDMLGSDRLNEKEHKGFELIEVTPLEVELISKDAEIGEKNFFDFDKVEISEYFNFVYELCQSDDKRFWTDRFDGSALQTTTDKFVKYSFEWFRANSNTCSWEVADRFLGYLAYDSITPTPAILDELARFHDIFDPILGNKKESENYYMWWDALRGYLPMDVIGKDKNVEQPAVVEQIFCAMKRGLCFQGEQTRVSALHGLNHLDHPEKSKAIQDFIDSNDLSKDLREYAVCCMQGLAL